MTTSSTEAVPVCNSASAADPSDARRATAVFASTDSNQQNASITGTALCAVCGEANAKMHYGVLACLGCKGFFRRALKKLNEYECLRDNNCTIDKQERNSCRSCRLKRCLEVGMDPAAVRPDRDVSGKQLLDRRRLSLSGSGSSNCNTSNRTNRGGGQHNNQRERCKGSATAKAAAAHGGGDAVGVEEEGSKNCGQRLPVEMRTMLMTLQNIEAKVVRGDTAKDASEIYPLHINTIREIINDPAKLRGRRTAIRYEPYRMARNEELCVIVYRRLIAAIDWVELLAERMGGLSTEDRIALVKACFGPLTLFKCAARTAIVTENENLLCLCNFAYVPREISKAYHDAYHLDNGLVERLLNDLVGPFRRIHLSEEEVVCMSAIIVLNPMARDLSEQAAGLCVQLRNRIYTTLYQIVKECRAECNPNVWFGNLLLYLPIVASLANAMCENLRFAQTFSTLGGIPLLTSLFGCFPVEPFAASELAALGVGSKGLVKDGTGGAKGSTGSAPKKALKERGTQTNDQWIILHDYISPARKRPLVPTSSLTEESVDDFRLLKAPCSYTLMEMFDDRINEEEGMEQQQQQQHPGIDNAVDRRNSDGVPPFEDAHKATATTTTSSNSNRTADNRESQMEAVLQQQQQHCWHVQPPSAQIKQLHLYDGTPTTQFGTHPLTVPRPATTFNQQQQQGAAPNYAAAYMPMPTQQNHYPSQYYAHFSPAVDYQFWHHNNYTYLPPSSSFWPPASVPIQFVNKCPTGIFETATRTAQNPHIAFGDNCPNNSLSSQYAPNYCPNPNSSCPQSYISQNILPKS